jgi:hypothetical protein
MVDKTLKIILVGSRYTGKGQIGRSWGKTNADLPTLQPVLLYDRILKNNNKSIRVVAWILSFDPEFESLRSSFYINPEPDGIIYTFDRSNLIKTTIEDIEKFKKEITKKIKKTPPAVVFGIRLKKVNPLSDVTIENAKNWANQNGNLKYFEADFEDTDLFNKNVEQAFECVVELILKK